MARVFRTIPAGRVTERIPINMSGTLLLGPEGERKRHSCRVIDVSPEGIRLKVNIPLEAGHVVVFIPPRGVEGAVRCSLVWVGKKERGNEGEAGLRYLAGDVKRTEADP